MTDTGPVRLRGSTPSPPLNVVLVEPEIPPNTGNVARLCAATGSRLHLVHPLGFSVDEKAVRRAGLDYWHLVDIVEHQSLSDFETQPMGRCFLFSGRTTRSYTEVEYRPGDYLVFGRESAGLPEDYLERNIDAQVGIPMPGAVRSINLSNAVALGVYEALRQLNCLSNPELKPPNPNPRSS